jgi:hypothetical protein
MAAGCAEALPGDGEGPRTDSEPVEVKPTFHLTGFDKLPSGFTVTDLGFSVSEIRLDPVEEDGSRIAYTNAEPITVDVDVHKGERYVDASSFELPESGTFDVTLRLEPISGEFGTSAMETGASDSGESGPSSYPYAFQLDGYINSEAAKAWASSTGKAADDPEPIPHPMQPETEYEEMSEDELMAASDWRPFTYASDVPLLLTLDRVNLEEGQQSLEVEVDIGDWGQQLIKPISEAVTEAEESDEDEEPSVEPGDGAVQTVDVTKTIDKRGLGPSSLSQDIRVQTYRPNVNSSLSPDY